MGEQCPRRGWDAADSVNGKRTVSSDLASANKQRWFIFGLRDRGNQKKRPLAEQTGFEPTRARLLGPHYLIMLLSRIAPHLLTQHGCADLLPVHHFCGQGMVRTGKRNRLGGTGRNRTGVFWGIRPDG